MNYVQDLVVGFVEALGFDAKDVREAHLTGTEVVIVERLAPTIYGAAATDRVTTINYRGTIEFEGEE